MSLSRAQLDELYRISPTGAVPVGETSGTTILAPGTTIGKIASLLIRWFAWQGKVFAADRRTLVNKISPFRIKAIKATVQNGDSRLDSREAIILDYSRTSLVARMIRDEVREVQPGLYLGKVYWGRWRLTDFALVPQGE